MADRVGQQLGNYRLIRLLGYGGFAEVYLGEHIYLKNPAAIKVLYSRLSKDELESFLVEGRTLVGLIHPHIVRVLEFGVEGDLPYLVMDYAPNGSLRQRYARGSILQLPLIISYVRQIADALQYAHNEKVIHREVKPANMLIGRRNELLLSDFGTAIAAQSSRYEGAQDMAGTVAYMAPEQIQSHPRMASDQYSLGIVVYEWLSGDRPFHGSFTEVIAKHAFVPPPLLREKIPSISPSVEQVILTALEKEPSKRFVSVSAFALALERASQSAQSHPLYIPSSAPDESMLPTFITPPRKPAQATSVGTPPVQPWQTPNSTPSSNRVDLSSLAPTRISTTPIQSRQDNQRGFRRPIVVGLLLLLMVGLIILGFVFFPILSNLFSNHTPASTPAAIASHSPGKTQIPPVYPNVAGNYSGVVHNTRTNQYSSITLSINQNQGSISGQFTVALPLLGTGPFTGSIDTNNAIQFTVVSNDTPEPIRFQGTSQSGILSGSYCSVDQTNQCGGGGYGTWSVTRQ